MKAWPIFRHSLRQLTGNLGTAARISAVPFALTITTALLLMGHTLFLSPVQLAERARSGQGAVDFLLALTVAIVFGIAFLWTAVAWHRFVLAAEVSGWLAPFHASRIAAYFGNSVLLGLIMVIPVLILMLGVTMISMMVPTAAAPYAFLLTIPVYLVLSAITLRLGTVLPGVALGHQTSLLDGMTTTGGQGLTSFWLAVGLGLTSMAVELIAHLLTGISPFLSVVWYILAQWFVSMLGLSILTTLYGHYIEKRPLI